MKPGALVLTALVQPDGRINARPALVLKEWQPFDHVLVCGISTRLHRAVQGFDELLLRKDPDFAGAGLRAESVIRLAFLGTIPRTDIRAVLGEISEERLERIRQRLCAVFEAFPRPPKNILGLIPARYASTRFPGKPLHPIAGKPLIQHVVERCQRARSLSEVVVATDDPRIRDAAQRFCRVEMTSPDHSSGTDRIAEVVRRCACDAAVNIQGDEPLIDPEVIDRVAGALGDAPVSTAAAPIRDAAEYDNPNVVKVVVNAAGQALYFSRRTIPYLRDAASRSVNEQLAAFPFLKHLGIYGYRREALLRLVQFPLSPLEGAEKLEQLRALDHGLPIAVVRVNYDGVGVDVPGDVARVEAILAGSGGGG